MSVAAARTNLSSMTIDMGGFPGLRATGLGFEVAMIFIPTFGPRWACVLHKVGLVA